jgi:Flp pilus assembly secretin CpaC
MQEPLEDLLAHLRAAIAAAEDGADNKDELARLTREVERRLSDEDDEGVVDDLREEVTKFEVSHPQLASIINRTADALSAMGL